MIAKQVFKLKTNGLLFTPGYFFSTPIQKKQKMELTIRTPYKTILQNFDGFQRILTKTNEAALIIQNKSPSALYVLPPGNIKIKLTQDVPGVASEYLHTGGWAIVHMDNTCEINFMDLVEKKDVKVDGFDKGEFPTQDNLAGRYATKLRKSCARLFTKKATQ